jgi:hypothetical protein
MEERNKEENFRSTFSNSCDNFIKNHEGWAFIIFSVLVIFISLMIVGLIKIICPDCEVDRLYL